jgi:hypothetical protein
VRGGAHPSLSLQRITSPCAILTRLAFEFLPICGRLRAEDIPCASCS